MSPTLPPHIKRNLRILRLLFIRYQNHLLTIFLSYAFLSLLFGSIYRLALILNRPKPPKRRLSTTNASAKQNNSSNAPKAHLLIVLGSGGHTTEMLSILRNLGPEYMNTRFGRRTWVVGSGDSFSAERAREFETWLSGDNTRSSSGKRSADNNGDEGYEIVTVRRAREIHQPLWTAPLSATRCLVDCVAVLRGTHADLLQQGRQSQTKKQRNTAAPDMILTNGPGTGVIVVVASILLMFTGLAPISTQGEPGAMRSIYIESWARVRTLSLSGKILRFGVGRFLVQWKGLSSADLMGEEGGMGVGSGEVGEGREKGKGKGTAKGVEGEVLHSTNQGLKRLREYVGPVVC